MDIVLLVLLIVIIKGIRTAPANSFHEDYFAKEKISTIKGIFVFLVLMGHCCKYFPPAEQYDTLYRAFRVHLNQSVVAVFLFYSGFGIAESIRTKGAAYVKSLPKKRILPLWLDFALILVLFFALQTCLGKRFSPKVLLSALFAWKSIGNSVWYIFVILAEYVFSCIAFLPVRRNSLPGKGRMFICICLLTGFSLMLIFFLRYAGKEGMWYNTLILFPLGAWYSLLRKPIEKLVMKNDLLYGAACLAAITLYYLFYIYRNSFYGFTLWIVAFMVCVILLSMKFSCKSTALDWFGNHVFSVYMLQRLPMLVLNKLGFMSRVPHVALILVILSTICLAELFDRCIVPLRKQILKLCRLA